MPRSPFTLVPLVPAFDRSSDWQIPAIPDRHQAKPETENSACDSGQDYRPVQSMADDNKRRASKGGKGVEINSEYDGCPGNEQIACDASADTGQHAQQRRHQRVDPVGKRLLSAGDGEERKSRCIEYQYRRAQRARSVNTEKRQQPGGKRHRKIAPVTDRGGRNSADQQVSCDAACTGRRE